jgi:N-carbamoylputrescine amidase
MLKWLFRAFAKFLPRPVERPAAAPAGPEPALSEAEGAARRQARSADQLAVGGEAPALLPAVAEDKNAGTNASAPPPPPAPPVVWDNLSPLTPSKEKRMARIVKCGLIQTSLAVDPKEELETIRNAQVERTLKYIDQAGEQGVQILSMQEIFTGPYFCAEQNPRWYDSVEKIPEGPTTQLMMEYAKKYNMVIVVPLYEEDGPGVYYNTAAVIDADGTYLGKYRKNHIPHTAPGFWEKYYFRPGNLGYPVFDTQYAKVGVYICYDRHFPEGARELGLAGAEIVFNPSATVAGLSEYLWKLEQPAHAVANGYFVGAINRVGFEAPWNIGEFYGQSYFCDPRGQIMNIAKRDEDALVTAELDLDKIREVRHTWQFYRDRRPETYNGIVRL